MMTRITTIARKNKFLFFLIGTLCSFGFWALSSWFEFAGFLRSHGFGSSKIQRWKDKYIGKRCFVVCTGPSLTVADLELLKDEYTFCMNSIGLLYEKTSFRPSFYGCIDPGVFRKMEPVIQKYDDPNIPVFGSGRTIKGNKLKDHWYRIPVNVAYHSYDRWFHNRFWCKFSVDANRGLYDMFSVTHFLIQVAVYMGFKDIYLVGCDCNQVPGKQVHFQEYGVADTTIATAAERNINGFEEIQRCTEKYGFKVYNATRGGNLEVFHRVSLDVVLLQK